MSEKGKQSETRTLTPSQLVAWSEDNTQVMRLKSGRDLLPGGYLASFAPVLVDWRDSVLSGESPFVVGSRWTESHSPRLSWCLSV